MLQKFVIRLVVNAVALAIIVTLLPQIQIGGNTQQEQVTTLLIVSFIFGLVNAFVKPLLKLLTCPLILLTFGLVLLLINGAMFWLTAVLAGGRLIIDDPIFVWSVIGGILMSLIGMILDRALAVIGID